MFDSTTVPAPCQGSWAGCTSMPRCERCSRESEDETANGDEANLAGKEPKRPLYRFVLTGGPCAGKTTALDRMSSYFRDFGFKVYTVPEAATLMFANGISLQDLDDTDVKFSFQCSLLSLQMQLEDGFERVARACGEPAVLLCDRGLVDGSAYISADVWARVLRSKGLDEVGIRDARYDAVFHLVTAAIGAEAHYSLENNATRSEPPDLAREMDGRTQHAWMGHPAHYVFDNASDFASKIERVIAAATRIVGLPYFHRGGRKFLLAAPPRPETFPVPHREFLVEKVFLQRAEAPAHPAAPGAVECTSSHAFVRKRTRDGFSSYSVVNIFDWADGSQTETTRIVTAREYDALVRASADPSRQVVRQRRINFIWEQQSFVVHAFLPPFKDVNVLHYQAVAGSVVSLPPFLAVERALEEGDGLSSYLLSLSEGEPLQQHQHQQQLGGPLPPSPPSAAVVAEEGEEGVAGSGAGAPPGGQKVA